NRVESRIRALLPHTIVGLVDTLIPKEIRCPEASADTHPRCEVWDREIPGLVDGHEARARVANSASAKDGRASTEDGRHHPLKTLGGPLGDDEVGGNAGLAKSREVERLDARFSLIVCRRCKERPGMWRGERLEGRRKADHERALELGLCLREEEP